MPFHRDPSSKGDIITSLPSSPRIFNVPGKIQKFVVRNDQYEEIYVDHGDSSNKNSLLQR